MASDYLSQLVGDLQKEGDSHERSHPLSVIARLAEITNILRSEYVELYDVLQAEKSQRLRVWDNSQLKYATDREKEADYAAMNLTNDILQLKGNIAALECERDFLRMFLEWK